MNKELSNIGIYILLGFISIIGQIILIRKFLIAFYGNELTVGAILAGWMLWTGAGSIILGKSADRSQRVNDSLSVVLALLSFLLLVTIFGVHCIKPLFNISVSEIVGLPMIIVSSIIISPLCICIGYSFSLCSRLSSAPSSVTVGRVYLYEAIGSALGGIGYSWLGINYIDPFRTALIIIIITSLTILLYLAEDKRIKCVSFVLIFVSLIFIFFSSLDLNRMAQDIRWKGYNPLYSVNSRFSDLTLTKNIDEYTLFANSSPMFTYPGKNHAENILHIAMSEHHEPRSVLIIGGGMSSIVDELFKYPVITVDYVQIDPLVTEIEKRYIPHTSELLSDPRLKVYNTDGRYYIKSIKAMAIYDVIIINLPDPTSVQLNRFYTKEFFSEAKGILKNDGVVLFSAGEPANYISPVQAQFLGSVYSTAASVFKKVIVAPLDRNYFIASDNETFLTSDPGEIIKRIKKRGIYTRFFRGYYINFSLSPERVHHIEERIDTALKTGDLINEDLNPITFYYDTALWGAHFGNMLPQVMMNIKQVSFFYVLIIPVLISILLLALKKMNYLSERAVIITGIGFMGFAGISLEIVILIAFQAIYGYLYYQIGLVITAFMVGLSAGAFLINKYFYKNRSSHARFFTLLAMLAFYQVIVILIIKFFLALRMTNTTAAVIFIIMMFAGAALNGMIFQTGADIYIKGSGSVGAGAGRINGADHIGSAIGGFITSIFLISIYGLINTLIFVMVLIWCMLLILCIGKKPLKKCMLWLK